MSTSKQYDDIIRAITRVPFQNRSFLGQLHSSMKVQASLKGLIGPIDAYLKETARIQSLYASLPPISDALSSPALELVRTANLNLSKLAGISNISAMLEQINKISKPWQEQLSNIGFTCQSIKETQLGLQSYISQISRLSLLAEQSIAGLDFDKLGMQLSSADQIQNSFRSQFFAISDSYSSLYSSFEQPGFNPLRFHPIVISTPSIEYYNHTYIAEIFTLEEPSMDKERTNLDAELSKETKDVLEELLGAFNPDLIPIWTGAIDALTSNNPDRIRHFTTSLRELHTHVLHQLAPDNLIKEWSNDPSFYDEKGRPTRKARLLYICRSIDHPPFSSFLEKDIQTVISFIDLFQRGTHEVRNEFTELQLFAMRLRAESSLRFILEVALRASGT